MTSEAEINVLANIKRKEDEFLKMVSSVIDETRALVFDEIKQITQNKTEYKPSIKMALPKFLNQAS
ncbi:hypothetical protein QM027_09530 [Campylobacter concisus]